MEELTALKMRKEIRRYLADFGKCPVYFSDVPKALFYAHCWGIQESNRGQLLINGLEKLGYATELMNDQILIWPGDELIRQYSCLAEDNFKRELWGGCSNWLVLHPSETLTQEGRQLIIDVLRITKGVSANKIDDLIVKGNTKKYPEILTQIRKNRQRAAVLLREKRLSGLYEAGVFLKELNSVIFFDT